MGRQKKGGGGGETLQTKLPEEKLVEKKIVKNFVGGNFLAHEFCFTKIFCQTSTVQFFSRSPLSRLTEVRRQRREAPTVVFFGDASYGPSMPPTGALPPAA